MARRPRSPPDPPEVENNLIFYPQKIEVCVSGAHTNLYFLGYFPLPRKGVRGLGSYALIFRCTNGATWSSASASLDGSLPPAWANVGLPPPLPPTFSAAAFTSSPASTPRLTRSSVTAAINTTRPSTTLPN